MIFMAEALMKTNTKGRTLKKIGIPKYYLKLTL
jgi:hypothetical protein